MRYRRHRMACSCPCVAVQGTPSPTREQLVHRHSAEKLRHENPRRGNSCARRRTAQRQSGRALGDSDTNGGEKQERRGADHAAAPASRQGAFTGHALTGAAAVLLLRGGGPAQAGAAGGRSRARVGGGGAVPDGGFGGRERCPRFPASGGGDQLRETEIGRRVSGAK